MVVEYPYNCEKCPTAKKLIAPSVNNPEGKLFCEACYGVVRKQFLCNLGQTVQKFTHVDKKTGKEVVHKLTAGKDWEISQRRISLDDNTTVVNRATGKEAQY